MSLTEVSKSCEAKLNRALQSSRLSLPRPRDPAEIGLSREDNARTWRRLDVQLIAFDPEVAPLLGAVPFHVTRHVDQRDEVGAFDTVLAAVGKHRLMKRSPFSITNAALAILGRGQHDAASFSRQHQVAFGMHGSSFAMLFGCVAAIDEQPTIRRKWSDILDRRPA